MTTPAAPGSYALLADGSTIEVRQATAQDADAVRDMHERMSADNAYLRFFSVSPMAPEREAQRICRPADPDHVALVGWQSGQLVGVASYEPAGRPGLAEIAFAVSDEMHGRGVGTLLLEHLISLARQRGLTAFAAETLPQNAAMQRVFADAGLPVERHFGDGVVELTLQLPGPDDMRLDSYLDSVAERASSADIASLRPLLEPASVAVIGAGRRRGSVGREILRNIVSGGFAGPVYPVNPKAKSMEGHRCLAAASDLPAAVDLAVIAVPAAAVAAVAADCGMRGVKALVVITASLGTGGADLLAICRRYGMRLVGPNCFGVAAPAAALNATFAARQPVPGVAGLVVQSGGVGIALLEHLGRLGVGVSSFASVGDKYDVSSNDMLTWWEHDGRTRLAVLYVESFGNPRAFGRTARRVGQQMPVLTVIGGRSADGQRAAASHTAAVATPVVTQEALFGQAGIVAAHGLGELIEAAALLCRQPLPCGNRVAIVSNAGGAGVLAADACGDNGLAVAVHSVATQRQLARILPLGAAVAGPVDTTATAGIEAFRQCLEQVAADDAVDAVLAVVVPTAIADLSTAISAAGVSKPMAAAVLGQADTVRMVAGVPAFAYPESAARALAHAVRYRAWRDRHGSPHAELAGADVGAARRLMGAFLDGHRDGGWLPAAETAQLLACYQIPVVRTLLALSADSAVAAAAELGGPVVLKAEADGLVHKSDAGAVKLDLRNGTDVAGAYLQLAASFGSSLRGVLVQPMLAGGVETFAGVVQEPVFGPLVVFGLGGVTTEVLGDHVTRLAPITPADAEEMVRGVHAAPLLLGYRGAPPVDIAGLVDLLLRVSRLAGDLPEISELDLNPVIARSDGVCAVDARVRLVPAAQHDPFLRQLR